MSECHLVKFINKCDSKGEILILYRFLYFALCSTQIQHSHFVNTTFPPFILSLTSSTHFPFVPCSWSAGQMGWEKANNPPISHMLFIHNITRCNALTSPFMFYKLFINSPSPAAQIYGVVASLYMFSVN